MNLPKPQNYDFLWLVNNQNFFQTSLYFFPEYQNRDFIFTGKNNWKVYLGKNERKRLSLIGLKLLQKNFSAYKNKVKKKIAEAYKFYKEVRNKNFSSLTSHQLNKYFLKIVKFVLSVMRLYFFTEYFLYDKVQAKIEETPKQNEKLFKAVREMQKIKFKLRKVALNETIFKSNIFENILKEIKRRKNRKNLSFFSYKEISNLLSGKKVEVVNRAIYVTGKFNNWKILTGKEALKIIKTLEKSILGEGMKKAEKQQEIRGQIANQGFYKGRVKIIPFDLKKNLAKEISKMKKGDVLITGSTGPEMILACKKAGAIITEEGGICSHAAIVSRELNVPCVIGTKIATQVLKDGDLIEVDANRGIVRKIV